MKLVKLAVVGSQNFDDYEYLKKILDYHPCTLIISGGAKGADRLAVRYAIENNIPKKEFFPHWKTYGKSAGAIRNKQIVDACDELVAFCDKIGREQDIRLRNIIDAAKCLNKPIYIIGKKENNKDDHEDFFSTI